MADKKISALTASTTPLAGTEVLPIVQGGATVKVSVANLTAGRNAGMTNAIFSNGFFVQTSGVNRWVMEKGASDNLAIYRYNDAGGYAGNPVIIDRANGSFQLENNLVFRTSGAGIDFSATPGTGTSELLADYEEGTWTPTQGSGLTVVGTFSSSGTYVKVGSLVFVRGIIQATTTVAAAAGNTMCGGLPFTNANDAGGGNATNFNVDVTSGLYSSGSSTNLFPTTAIAATFQILFGFSYRV